MSIWRTLWRLFIAALAIAALGFAATVTYAPELLPSEVRLLQETATEQFDANTVLLSLGVLGVLGGLVGLWIWRAQSLGTEFYDPAVEESNRDVPVAGYSLRVTDTIVSDVAPNTSVEEALRDVLLEIYRPEFEDRAEAKAYLERGEWTDDRYAAAFISTSREIDYPLTHRIIAWLYPDRARETRVDRTLRAVESVADNRFSLYEKPTVHQPSGIERIQSLILESMESDQE